MRIVWTAEALDDLEYIIAYYHEEAGPVTAAAIQARIILEVERLPEFPERIRNSDRIPVARELVIHRLPYIAFVQIHEDTIQILNVVHTARQFPKG
jgi:plasmid stabilization system protein ParE